MKSMRDKYMNDNHYRMAVDIMEHWIHECQFTPSEMREMAVLACINYEMHALGKIFIPMDKDLVSALRIIQDKVDATTMRNAAGMDG